MMDGFVPFFSAQKLNFFVVQYMPWTGAERHPNPDWQQHGIASGFDESSVLVASAQPSRL